MKKQMSLLFTFSLLLSTFSANVARAEGLEVNVAEDKIGSTAATLRAVLKAISDDPDTYLESGRCTVRFAASLFNGRDVLTIPLEQAQMTADCAYPLVLKPPAGKRLVLNGGGKWRALYVTPRTKLILENVTFSNCLAVDAGVDAAARTTSGGALVNDGSLVASGCVFSDNAASGGTKIMPAPSGNGGAVLNRGDAVFERCTFARNQAAAGGAICNSATGRLTVVSSTFSGNHAISGNTTVGNVGGNGGAIAQTTASDTESPDTLLVNCTITGNAADGVGGAVYAQGTNKNPDIPALVLADVIAVGNAGTYDLCHQSGAGAKAFYTVFGNRNDASASGWGGASATEGTGVIDLFADVTADGSAAVPTVAEDGQVTFPLVPKLTYPTAWVRHNDDWTYADCATKKSASSWSVLRNATDIPPRQQPTPTTLETDQLGKSFKDPPLGATSETKDDPCVIYSTDPAEIALQLAAFNSKADALARHGVVTVSFDSSVTGETVSVDCLLGAFTGFTNVSLVIEGPITLDAGDSTRFFTIGAGNTVEFRDVTFLNGRDREAGGAIQGEHCDLTCTRCAFLGCSAPYGGAVCLDYADSRGLFTDCLFYGNGAERGNAVYNDGCDLTFIRTLIRPADIDVRPCASVEHSPRQIAENPDWELPDYFANTEDAVRALESGSKLVLLNADAAKDLNHLEVPPGVEVEHRFVRVVGDMVIVEGDESSLEEGIKMAEQANLRQVLIQPGVYEPAEVPSGLDGLVLVGVDPMSCVIDGFGQFRCLTVKSDGVTLKGLTFANGLTDGDGGGVSGEGVQVAAAIDCTFTNCTAQGKGGGIAGVREIRGCRFVGNVAGTSGGGASQAVRDVIGSVFAFNAAQTSAACAQDGAAGRFDHCTFYGNVNAGDESDRPEGDFNLGDAAAEVLVDPEDGDFRIRADRVTEYAVVDLVAVTNALEQGWIGADGEPLAQRAGDWAVMTRGAINGWDMTVQAAVDGAAMGDTVEVEEGVYPPLFVGEGKLGVTVRAKDGARVTIDGGGRFRGVTDASAGLVLEGLVITNGVATAFGDFGPNGGGYCGVPGNGATLLRCTITGCSAHGARGGGVYGADAVISSKIVGNTAAFGGGVAGSALVRTSLILRNRATGATGGYGGGVYGRLEAGKVSEVKNCTFVGNTADAGSGLYEGVETHNLFFDCGWANVKNPTGLIATESPFVDAAAGDWRPALGQILVLAIPDLDYAAAAREEGWISPDGDPLVLDIVDKDFLMAGAYASNIDLRLQEWIDAADPGDTILVPSGDYAPVEVDVGNITIVATGATCVIECGGFFRGVTVEKSDVTIAGFTVRNGDMARWADIKGFDCTGGAILGDGSTVASNCTFTGCRAVNGGAAAGMRMLSDCTFTNCTATGDGGAVFSIVPGALVTGCTFTDNAATKPNSVGGALSAENALVAGCFFRGNSAVCGGALAARAGVRTICCTFAGNTATGPDYAESASAAFAEGEGQMLADCVLFNDTQTGFGTEGRVIVTDEDPFVASATGDWRLRSDLFAAAVDFGSAAAPRIALVRDADGIKPGGGSLVSCVADMDVLFAGAYGLAASNELQDLIDRTSPGDAIVVPAGAYLPAVIPEDKTGLTLTGAGAAVVDGYGTLRCLTVKADGVTLKGLTFANGWTDGNGGGVSGEGATVASVIGCTFTNCTAAANGGGIAGVDAVISSLFEGNVATNGAAAYNSALSSCTFVSNAVTAAGGETVAGGSAQYSVFVDNPVADGTGNLATDMDFFVTGTRQPTPEATFANLIDGAEYVVAAADWTGPDGRQLVFMVGGKTAMTVGAFAPEMVDPLLQSLIDAAPMDGIVEIPSGAYGPARVSSEKGALTLKPEEGATAYAVDELEVATNVLAQGWIGADGQPLAQKAGDWAVMTYGAINCWDMTVQAAVDGAEAGSTVEVEEGVYPPLFVGAEKSGVTVWAKNGARVTIDGGGCFRGVTDASQGLTLAGLVITNGVATSSSVFGPNGGGYCGVSGNGATLKNCTVTGCMSPSAWGGGVYGADAVIGSKIIGNGAGTNGGGVSQVGAVRCSLFEGNVAANGAAAYNSALSSCTLVSNSGGEAVSGVDASVRYSVFVGNAAAAGTGNLATNMDFFVAGTWQPTPAAVIENLVDDAGYIAAAVDWTGPDGRELVITAGGEKVMTVGAFAPEMVDRRLQDLIDMAPKDGVVEIPSGTYGPATVSEGKGKLTLRPEQGAEVTIDGFGLLRCLTVEADGVTLRGLTFANGWADYGGGVYGEGSGVAEVIDCTFTNCTATANGGGIDNAREIRGCRFLGNHVGSYGGGAHYVGMICCSLFEGNVANTAGSAVNSCSKLLSCTFVSNSGGETITDGSAQYSVFVDNPTVAGTGNLATNMDFFAAGPRRPTPAAAMENLITDAEYVAAAADWTGPDGRKLVLVEDGVEMMTVGAYAPAAVVTVMVKSGIQHVTGFTVSNAVERIEGEDVTDGTAYRVLEGDDVFVGYTVEEGYTSKSANPLRYSAVKGDITVDAGSIEIWRNIPYGAWNEETRQMEDRLCADYEIVTADLKTLEDGKWYVVTNEVSCGTITVNGAAHLILADGAKLTVETLTEGTLTIHGQREGSGSLKIGTVAAQVKNAKGEDVHCVTVECGVQSAECGVKVEGLEGYLTQGIYSIDGKVCLWLPDGTYRFSLSDGATSNRYLAVVNGGDLVAEPLAPVGFFVNGVDVGDIGIGDGWVYFDQVLLLTDATEYVLSGVATNNEVQVNAAASGATAVLSNAVVFASGRPAVEVAPGATLTVAANQVMRTGETPEAMRYAETCTDKPCVLVGPGMTVMVKDIPHVAGFTVSNAVERIEGEDVTDGTAYRVLEGDDVFIGYTVEEGYTSKSANPLVYTAVESDVTVDADTIPTLQNITYRAWSEETQQMEDCLCADYIVVTNEMAVFEDGKWYVVTNEVSRGTITVKGAANLILADGAKLTANGDAEKAGIMVTDGNTLRIWGQALGSGKLEANGDVWGGAGIGGGYESASGTVEINGGMVTATGNGGAGLGGGGLGTGGTVTINGGTVTATGIRGGAGIGGGASRAGGTVTINGGTVMATGNGGGAGIGGGDGRDGAGCAVTINGGTVTATSNGGGAGIGAGGADIQGNAGADGTVTLGARVEKVEGDIGSGHPYVKFAEKPAGPACEGGEIAEEGGTWVVTPTNGATAVTIEGLPEGETVAGVKIGGVDIPSGAFMGFGTGENANVFSLALNPEGVVTIDDKEIPVTPTIGDLDDGEPFTVSEGSAAVTVRAIPGLKYTLRRWETLDAESAVSSKPPYQVVADKVAEGASVTLSDGEPPEGQAFYRVVVSVP